MSYHSDLNNYIEYKPVLAINSHLDKLVLLLKVSRLLEDILNNRLLTGQASEDTLQAVLDKLTVLKESLNINATQIVSYLIDIKDKLEEVKEKSISIDTSIDDISEETTTFFEEWKTGLATESTQNQMNDSLEDLAIDVETSTTLTNQIKINIDLLQNNSTESLHDLEADIEGLMLTVDNIIESIDLSNLTATLELVQTEISNVNDKLEELEGITSSVRDSLGVNLGSNLYTKLDQLKAAIQSLNSEGEISIFRRVQLSTGGLNELMLEYVKDAHEYARRIAVDDYAAVYAKYGEVYTCLQPVQSIVTLLGAIKDNLEAPIA